MTTVGVATRQIKPAAVVYCEGNFASVDGKTANGLIHQSDSYEIVSVIDSSKDGVDSGVALFGHANGIPILRDIDAALHHLDVKPEVFIYGLAPSTGRLSQVDRDVVSRAIAHGMHVVCGLHEFLGDDPFFRDAAKKNQVNIYDIRKPKPNHVLRIFDGSISLVKSKRIAVMGTDCAIGKRTTATILDKALNSQNVKTILVATGQTGLMQGARYGVVMDALPSPKRRDGSCARLVLAIGNQDTDIKGLGSPSGIQIIGSTSDHMVVHSQSQSYKAGSEIKFSLNYSAFSRAMNSCDVETFVFDNASNRTLGALQ